MPIGEQRVISLMPLGRTCCGRLTLDNEDESSSLDVHRISSTLIRLPLGVLACTIKFPKYNWTEYDQYLCPCECSLSSSCPYDSERRHRECGWGEKKKKGGSTASTDKQAELLKTAFLQHHKHCIRPYPFILSATRTIEQKLRVPDPTREGLERYTDSMSRS